MNSPSGHERSAKIAALIRPLTSPVYTVDYEWRRYKEMLAWLADGTDSEVEMIPDFQRGHVWSDQQQVHFIENVLRGVIESAGITIQFNAPCWERKNTGDLGPTVQCIDGLQRFTAVKRFVEGEIKPFGMTAADFDGTPYRVLEGAGGRYRFRLVVHSFQNRKELLQHYLDLNSGGTPHAESEILRVRGLLANSDQRVE